MEIFTLNKSPNVYDWEESVACSNDLDEYDRSHFKEFEPDAMFFWYVSGSYEGSGALIAVKDGRWYDKSLSHCSCYGPFENFANKIEDYQHPNLDSLLAAGSEEWKKEYGPLVELAKSNGYK